MAMQSASAASHSTFASSTVISIRESPAYARAIEAERAESNPDGLGCARGLRSAFLLEAGVVLLVYLVWHLWHLAR